MKITSEIIVSNLNSLKNAKSKFSILNEYQDICMKMPDSNLIETQNNLRSTAISFGLSHYIDFIDFIVKTTKSKQEIFYRFKIKNVDFQKTLSENATDKDAITCFKTKTKKTFQNLVNSDRWLVFQANTWKISTTSRRRKSRYNDNVEPSSAIIANYIIQNELDIEDLSRINKYYTTPIPDFDDTVINEMDKTKDVINFLCDKLSECDVDYRKINMDYFTKEFNKEVRNRMLSVATGEKIKCVSVTTDTSNLTIGKYYDVISKQIDGGILKVTVTNDRDIKCRYNYRLFESVSNLRDSTIDDLFK